jgi:hypothetical protein
MVMVNNNSNKLETLIYNRNLTSVSRQTNILSLMLLLKLPELVKWEGICSCSTRSENLAMQSGEESEKIKPYLEEISDLFSTINNRINWLLKGS